MSAFLLTHPSPLRLPFGGVGLGHGVVNAAEAFLNPHSTNKKRVQNPFTIFLSLDLCLIVPFGLCFGFSRSPSDSASLAPLVVSNMDKEQRRNSPGEWVSGRPKKHLINFAPPPALFLKQKTSTFVGASRVLPSGLLQRFSLQNYLTQLISPNTFCYFLYERPQGDCIWALVCLLRRYFPLPRWRVCVYSLSLWSKRWTMMIDSAHSTKPILSSFLTISFQIFWRPNDTLYIHLNTATKRRQEVF